MLSIDSQKNGLIRVLLLVLEATGRWRMFASEYGRAERQWWGLKYLSGMVRRSDSALHLFLLEPYPIRFSAVLQ